jgi:hypothetical protein
MRADRGVAPDPRHSLPKREATDGDPAGRLGSICRTGLLATRLCDLVIPAVTAIFHPTRSGSARVHL